MTREFQRSASTYYNTNYEYSNVPSREGNGDKMHGSRRVILFCFLTTVLPTILIVLPLYLRNIKYADVMYKISDSDVIQIHKGQSSLFCEKHSLRMNTTFNAFQMRGVPQLSGQKKHIRLKKSMTLRDDTHEYWGFYLLKGATVELNACSRYQGSKIIVVKGERLLNTCGILGEKYIKPHPLFENQKNVMVTLEDPKKRKKPSVGTSTKGTESDERDDNVDYKDFSNKTTWTSSPTEETRQKRDTSKLHKPNTVLDTGVHHGGNAVNVNATASSVTIFENSLHECYHENIVVNNYFPFSLQCNSTKYLERTTTLNVKHEALVDAYYYYIIYNHNDFAIKLNDIHVIFDIYKPTFQYVNNSHSKMCVNKTDCEFQVGFLSDELVIVEVPTKEGLQNKADEESVLISVCHPRVSVYICFPVAVLLLVLLFSFL